MIATAYRKQAGLLIDVLPDVEREQCFAMHGGSAINLFVRDLPRLSVDIDLTYLPIENRAETLANIDAALESVASRITRRLSGVKATLRVGKYKLDVVSSEAQIKIEVNTVMRGALGEPVTMPLNETTQAAFDRFAQMRILPVGQLYGGKVCAALDRQHPRDLFDIKSLFDAGGMTPKIHRGFLLCLLCSDRPIHELLRPNLQDQRQALVNQFAGMTERPFTYDDYEATRTALVETVNAGLDGAARRFLATFADGAPEWANGFADFEKFPGVQWKLQNIRKLMGADPAKHQEQSIALRAVLDR